MRRRHVTLAALGLACACAAGPMQAGSAASNFAVHIELSMPAGCVGSVGAAAGTSLVTLVCGDNLFVNVRPTVVSVGSGSFQTQPAAGAAPGAGTGPTPGSSTGDDDQPVVDGVLYVQAPPPEFGRVGGTRPWRSVQVALSRQPLGANGSGFDQAVEMWLIF